VNDATSRSLPDDLERLLHDLRGPLNALAMHAEVLKRAVTDDAIAALSVRTVQHETERLADMLLAAMSVIALERGETRVVNLKTIVERAIAEHGFKDVRICDGAWPDVCGDPRLLELAVGHLVANAVEATAAAGAETPRPAVSGERRGGMAWLIVRDHGIGLRSTNPKVLIRLRASKKPGHAGLGLVTVERIARLHGGSLRFESPDTGARVLLALSM
jgi:signal transduction histidine kinase